MGVTGATQRLKKELGLFDVFAIGTGAMFSSGFFLLPGLAAAKAGPAVMVAYFIAGILILPAMFSKAELSTALPRAGGTYFFLDRSLGPMAGTVGGLGTYMALTLKTAFALIGIGAYAAFFVELPIKPVAVVLTAIFMALNIFGAKETTTLQKWLVIILLSVLALFTIRGGYYVAVEQPFAETKARFTPFMTETGIAGILSTVGFVFVSYAGLTKVASVAEEVKNPDRNIPLGMMLSLGITSVVYVVGVGIMVAVVDMDVLKTDLRPVATTAEVFFDWLPQKWGLLLIVAAAMAAFASTGNAGLMSASRYPLAMARDRLLPAKLGELGRFQTPVPAILVTGAIMIFFILVLDAEGIAKLASAFQLFIFMLVNLAVIVMRESRITSYDPGYRSPLYPWMQIFGIVTSMLLIVYMGWMAILFTLGIIIACIAWYFYYARDNMKRDGAIYHWFERLGRRQYEGLDREFRGIMKEKGLRDEDPFDEIVARSLVVDVTEEINFEDVLDLASEQLAKRLPKRADKIKERFMKGTLLGDTPVTCGVALPHFRTDPIQQAELVLVRSRHAITMPASLTANAVGPHREVHTVFCLVSPEHNPGQHLRILAQIAGRVDEDEFAADWAAAKDPHELREVLLRDEHFVTLRIDEDTPAAELDGVALRDLRMPAGTLVALIHRGEIMKIPSGKTILRIGDRLTVIGETKGLKELGERYGNS